MVLVNHTSTISGAEVSLLDLIEGLTPKHDVTMAVPTGALAGAARARGASVAAIPAAEGSLRLDPRPTIRTLAAITSAGFAVRRIARDAGADVIHANSFRAGLVASVAAGLGAPDPLVHVRDCLPPSAASKAVQRTLSRSARMILANSAFTAACFDGAPGGAPITVVDNPIDLDRFDPQRVNRSLARAELGLRPECTVLVVLAQITPWKGQDTAVHATRLLRERGHDVHLLIAGSVKFRRPLTRYDNDAYVRQLHATVDRAGLGGAVTFTGECTDAPRLLRAADCVLVPSWAEPWGRVVAEAMAMGTPVVATNVGGPTEMIEDSANGLLAPPHRPRPWADAVERLIEHPDLRDRVSNSGRATAGRFSRAAHVERVVETYRAALGKNGTR